MTLNRTEASLAALSYNYNGNQLTTVSKGGTTFRTYTYDGNGNATTDGGTKSINYNMLNLPATVTQSGTTLATYTYEASGTKIRNTGSDGTWDYVSGIVYKTPLAGTTPAIAFIQTEEGRAIPNGNDYSYQYNLKDHLGNDRVSLDKNGVLQEDEYYAFGLRNPKYDNSNNNRYLYNGKEIQTDLVSQYDYGARFYDPVIARWTTSDPLAEKGRRWSPYGYAFDNPMRFTDPDGMWPDWGDVKNFAKGFVSGVVGMAESARPENMIISNVKLVKNVVTSLIHKDVSGAAMHLANVTGVPAIVKTTVAASKGNANAMGQLAAVIAVGVVAHNTGGSGAKPPTPVTAETISKALEGSTMKTTQGVVSLPVIQRFVNMLEAGSTPPAIKVADGVIIEGNHRYVAGRVFGQEPATVPGNLSPSQAPLVKPVQETVVDPVDHGNH
ncbi:RHS repeat-associated protein [Mucilaginibacter gracilis]|uniref:RHS repeat-associated protein n=2 Tax=Mucilaginibacter gracilis TaxID=423350 RepID=A0A495J5M9_9SPHI|nr:RHS repeat-associated protein [Mucilaginibacter gracilis]